MENLIYIYWIKNIFLRLGYMFLVSILEGINLSGSGMDREIRMLWKDAPLKPRIIHLRLPCLRDYKYRVKRMQNL